MPAFFTSQQLKEDFDIDQYSDELISNAEFDVLSRYVQPTQTSHLPIGTFSEQPFVYLHPKLRGYAGTINEPNLDIMDDQLIYNIRRVVASYIVLMEEGNRTPTNVDSISQGDQSISYNGGDPQLKNVYQPLQIYDDRGRGAFL